MNEWLPKPQKVLFPAIATTPMRHDKTGRAGNFQTVCNVHEASVTSKKKTILPLEDSEKKGPKWFG